MHLGCPTYPHPTSPHRTSSKKVHEDGGAVGVAMLCGQLQRRLPVVVEQLQPTGGGSRSGVPSTPTPAAVAVAAAAPHLIRQKAYAGKVA